MDQSELPPTLDDIHNWYVRWKSDAVLLYDILSRNLIFDVEIDVVALQEEMEQCKTEIIEAFAQLSLEQREAARKSYGHNIDF